MLLQRTIRFGDKRAAEAMTPRVDVVGAARRPPPSPSCSTPSRRDRAQPVPGLRGDPRPGHRRGRGAPTRSACRRRAGATTTVAAVAREPVYVPESLDLDGVLAALQAAGADLAIVVDEYGGTDGVVTVEDLVEELVGEIADEYDPDAVDDAGAGRADRAGRRADRPGRRRAARGRAGRADRLPAARGPVRDAGRLPDGPARAHPGRRRDGRARTAGSSPWSRSTGTGSSRSGWSRPEEPDDDD